MLEFSSSSACFIGGKVELINSPQKRILFQTRYQGGEQEIIIGVIKINKFLEMLKSKKIFFNVCYIVESDSY